LVAVIVTREPVLVAIDVEVLRQAVFNQDGFTPVFIVEK